MKDQPKFRPLDPSSFFSDGRSARMPVSDTIARGHLPKEKPPVTSALLARGRERYDIFCAVCHGRTGDGQGMIVKRGFPAPPSYMEKRLKKASANHFYAVITNGYGKMYSYSDRIPPEDRWAIIAYIRALQLSQDAQISQLPSEDQTQLLKLK